MKRLVLLLAGLLISIPTFAEVKTKEITYQDGDTTLKGYLAWDTNSVRKIDYESNTPAVLIVHQWMGLTEYEKARARQIAQNGYVVFALDIYGSDFNPTNMQEAGKASGTFKKIIASYLESG